MFQLIGGIIKYSLLILCVLVLSHIIEIKGVTLSQHVEHSLNWIAGLSPKKDLLHQARQLANLKSNLNTDVQTHLKQINEAADLSISPDDQKKLDRLIQRAENKK